MTERLGQDDRADFGNAFNPMAGDGCLCRGYIGLVCRLDKRQDQLTSILYSRKSGDRRLDKY